MKIYTISVLLIFIAYFMHISALSDADINRLEEQWLDDDEEVEEGPMKIIRDKDGTAKRIPNPNTPKQEMCFVKVKSASKAQTDELAKRWVNLLKTGTMETNGFAVEDDMILFVLFMGKKQLFEVQKFILDQPETIYFEYNQKKMYPKKSEL